MGTLVRATIEGCETPVYEEDYGNSFWIFEEPCGNWGRTLGIVRADSMESAHEAAFGEFADDATVDDVREYYPNFRQDEDGNWPDLPEGYYYAENVTGIISLDPGWLLTQLTREIIKERKIELFFEKD